MRVLLFLFALLGVPSAHAFAATPGLSGEWHYYGNRDGTVRIDEASGMLEDETTRTSYVLLEEQGANWRRVAKKGGSPPGDTRKILRVHENVLLFPGDKHHILVRKVAPFAAPREKIRGRWHYAEQMNEAFYYDAEFDLDAGKMVEISRSENGGHTRSEGRLLETLLDARAELALRTNDAVYHFKRLGDDFLVLEPSYAASTRNGYKILLKKAQKPQATKIAKPAKTRPTDGENAVAKPQADGQRSVEKPQAETKSGTAKASKAKARKKKQRRE
jgi:hypothetical protein